MRGRGIYLTVSGTGYLRTEPFSCSKNRDVGSTEGAAHASPSPPCLFNAIINNVETMRTFIFLSSPRVRGCLMPVINYINDFAREPSFGVVPGPRRMGLSDFRLSLASVDLPALDATSRSTVLWPLPPGPHYVTHRKEEADDLYLA